MAKVSTYPRETNPAYNDLLYLVHDPSSPLSKTLEIANLSKALGWVDVRAYGAKGDGVTDDTAAIQDAIDSLPNGGTILFPEGRYLCNSSIVISGVSGIFIKGVGANLHTVDGKSTILDFTNLENDSNGILINDSKGTTIQDIYIYSQTGTGGSGILATACEGLSIDRTHITWHREASSYGIKFGATEVSESVTVSEIRKCDVSCNGTPFLIGQSCTSISLYTCYALTSSSCGFHFKYCNYIGIYSCASDVPGEYGYRFEGSVSIGVYNCGAELCGKSAFRIDGGSTEITFISPYGYGNNTGANVNVGSLIDIGDTSNIDYNIVVIGGRDNSPNAATTNSIYANEETLWTTIIGANDTSLPKGIGGDSTWYNTYLVISGSQYDKPSIKYIEGSATYDPVSLDDGQWTEIPDITVSAIPGFTPTFGDYVIMAAPYNLQGIIAVPYIRVSTIEGVQVRIALYNHTGGTIDLDSGTWYVRIYKR